MEKQTFTELLAKYNSGTASNAERVLVEAYYENLSQPRAELTDADRRLLSEVRERLMKLTAQPKIITMLPRRRWLRIAAAAVFIGIMAMGGWLLLRGPKPAAQQAPVMADVQAPAKNRATISLANGQTVYLDSSANGQLASLGSVQLIKLADGKIAYSGNRGEVTYNTISNPRGSRVIDMELTDGSHVWLNAGSSMTYPVPLTGKTRDVTVKGEAYFEVAKDASRPFTVSNGETRVTVLGTHFNVNAYEGEKDVKITLLEGSVIVNTAAASGLLKPGQQAQVTNQIKVVSDVDTEQVMAWKNGQFAFYQVSLSTLLREIERWYDVQVEVRGNMPDRTFTLNGSRTMKLSELLRGFEVNHVPYSIDGDNKKLVVNP